MTQVEASSSRGGSAFGRLQGHGQRRVVSGGDVGEYNNNSSDEEGSSIMGRAANIANTAKDLLGALWYGANPSANAASGSGGQGGADQSKKSTRHKRGASIG